MQTKIVVSDTDREYTDVSYVTGQDDQSQSNKTFVQVKTKTSLGLNRSVLGSSEYKWGEAVW